MPMLNFVTSDEIPISVDFEIIRCSNFIKSAVGHTGFTDEVIPLMIVDSCTMQLIVTWATRHKDDLPLPDDYEVRREVLPEWDDKFFSEMSRENLTKLLRAANFLNIPRLVQNGCQAVANLLTGKTGLEMRDSLGFDKMKELEIANNLKFNKMSSSDEDSSSELEEASSSLKTKSQEQQNEN